MQKNMVKIEIPKEALKQVGMLNASKAELKIKDGTLIIQKSDLRSPLLQRYLVIYPLLMTIFTGIISLIYWIVQGMHQIPLTGYESIASMSILVGLITGSLFFIGFFIKNRNDPSNNFSRRIYWRNFPVITAAFISILALSLFGIFWVLGTLFPASSFDPLTSAMVSCIFVFLANASMTYAAFKIDARTLANILSVVIVTGVVISMASNGSRHWWEHNFSFLGTQRAQSAWQFNVTLVFSALLMIALIDYLFVSLEDVYKNTSHRRLNLLRFLLIMTAIDFGAVGAFPNNANFHHLHDFVAGQLVSCLVILIISIRWLLPKIDKEFLRISYGMGMAMVLLQMGFRWINFPTLTAFEIEAFTIAFMWLLMLFAKLQSMINEGPDSYTISITDDSNLN